MKLFVDTANLEELEQCLKRGFPSGVTTNPSILSKEQRRDFRVHINDMIELLLKYKSTIPLSVEVFTADLNEAMQAGADILTVPPKFFPQMCGHPKTDEAVKQFVTEFQKWQEKPAVLPLAKSA